MHCVALSRGLISYPRSPAMCVSEIYGWWRTSGPCSNRCTLENKLSNKTLFIPARFQFPSLNIRKIDWGNFFTYYTAGDILRDFFLSRLSGCTLYSRRGNSCSNKHVEAQISSTFSSSLLLLEYTVCTGMYCCELTLSKETSWNDTPETSHTVRTLGFC
jgi:hypothetical protein